MSADLGTRINLTNTLELVSHYLKRPIRLFSEYDRENLRPDLIAGITVAVILLPQAIAFALIADLPPQMGLYAAVIGALVGALWGSSNQVHTGPTNAISLLVFASLSGVVPSGTAEFVIAAGVMAVMVGVFQLLMGLARLGMLVNFVSHSVIVGFASGAGILIGIKQLGPLVGLTLPREHIYETFFGFITGLPQAHIATAQLGIGTIIFILLLRRLNPRLPAALMSMVLASIVVALFGLHEAGVAVIGQLPSSLPPLADLPLFNPELIARLSTGALAVGAIGLVETTAIARSVAAQTGQRLDSNQEFVGQGMANLFSGLFSGYATAGSFSRTAVNFKSNARSPMAAIFSGLFVLIAMFTLAPLAVYLPTSALAGVLIITAYGMIDREEIARIWRSGGADRSIMAVTLLGTLFLEIEFAVLAGIILSLALYILRTSSPRVHTVLPDDNFNHFFYQPEKDECVQLAIIEILGDLYFGAVNHVEEFILNHAAEHPEQRFLLIRMNTVNTIDFSGIHMLENVVRIYREMGGDVFLVRVNPRVRRVMAATEFEAYLGSENFLNEDEAVSHIFYRVLDPAICIYECPVRAFRECQNLPKQMDMDGIPVLDSVPQERIVTLEAKQLWQRLHSGENGDRPMVIDVREPREYRQGHVAEAKSVPLSRILSDEVKLPNDRQIVLVCRSGRRSRRAAQALQRIGCMNVSVLDGGMVAWESAGLLEAVDGYGVTDE